MGRNKSEWEDEDEWLVVTNRWLGELEEGDL